MSFPDYDYDSEKEEEDAEDLISSDEGTDD